MHQNLRLAAVAGCLLLLLAGCRGRAGEEPKAAATDSTYTPQAVFCADGSGSLCGVMPSMIGPDPEVDVAKEGYEGLSSDVQSFDQDSQTPFDNMSWQMFVALNQSADGGYVWQTYPRVESVFGPPPPAFCDNPQNLPVFTLTTKSDGQPDDRDEEFLQAATDKPLIDRNGNWTVFERRMNDVEVSYLKNVNWNLTTLAGQQAFVEAGNTVDFTEGADVNPPTGSPGAMEIKLAWRILDTSKGDDPSRYLTINALLAVEATEVRDSGGQPICANVQLGLVGFHIIQKNPQRGVLLPQWIWASFEHQDNVPLSPNACDPVTATCYAQPNPTVCTAPTDATGTWSFFNAGCTNGGAACPANTAPSLLQGETEYLWSPQPPYAGAYLYDNQYGTQVARCWQIYYLTQQLNTQWQQKLQQANSVLANYMLIGTQWGGNVEPRPGVFVNGGVPAFLANSTLETYIQTDKKFGTCLGCHSTATMAYQKGTTTYDANFSFLLGLAD